MWYIAVEIALCILEPVLVFFMLKAKLGLKKKALPFAISGIVLTAAYLVFDLCVRYHNSDGNIVRTLIISGVLYCLFALLLFSKPEVLRVLWALIPIYFKALSYMLLRMFALLLPDRYVVRDDLLCGSAFVLAVPLVLLAMRTTKDIVRHDEKTSALAAGSAAASIGAMFILLYVTEASAEAGFRSVWFGIAGLLILALDVLLMILFGRASVSAQRYTEERVLTDTLGREVKYNFEITSVVQTVRQLKHDYSNHMSVIAALSAEGDIEGLRKYMSDYSAEYGSVDRYALTGDNMLDSLFSYKKMICDADGIELKITALGDDIRRTGLSAIELSSLFGNLIDNSINACRKLESGKRIDLSIRKMADMLSIRIENGRIEEEEKERDGSHGLGLPRIKSIVEAHDGICTITPEKDRFTVEILLPEVSQGGR